MTLQLDFLGSVRVGDPPIPLSSLIEVVTELIVTPFSETRANLNFALESALHSLVRGTILSYSATSLELYLFGNL